MTLPPSNGPIGEPGIATMDCLTLTSALRICSTVLLLLVPFSRAISAEPKQMVADTATASAPSRAIGQPTPITRGFRNDATLHGITFISPTTGWAVGDRGVIWHTDDAGTTWRQQL
jgi:hypothetical protein